MSAEQKADAGGRRGFALSRHAFTRFWHVHAWAGVLTSLIVYVMFLLGSLVLFYKPLTIWEEPLVQRRPVELNSLQSLLELAGPLPDEFWLYLPQSDRALPKVGYYLPNSTAWRMWWLDIEHGQVIPQRELAAAYLYDLHYLWHDVTGYWLQYGAGVLVFGMLLAIVTGVLIQLRNATRQLNQFRPDRTTRVLFSDLHKVLGVFGLPFQFVYALTGAMMVLSPLLFELSIGPVFGGDSTRAADTAGALVEEPPPRDYGPPRRGLSLDALWMRARAAEPRLMVESVVFRGYLQEQGTVDIRGEVEGQPFGDGLVRLRARDGHVELVETPDNERAVGTVARWIHGLHTVHYGGLQVRLLLALLGFAGCVTILTGNWIWLERRAARGLRRGDVLLARLTAGVGAGAIVAVCALFLASRLMPMDWLPRLKVEERLLAVTFLGCIGWALAEREPLEAWWRQLLLAASMLAVTPLAARSASQAGLFGAGPKLEPVVGVEIGMYVLASVLLATALWLRKIARRRADEAERKPQAAAAQPHEKHKLEVQSK